MTNLKLFFSDFLSIISINSSSTRLNKILSLIRTYSPLFLLLILVFTYFNSHPNLRMNTLVVGDSLLTSSLIEKEKKQKLSPSTINSQYDLKKIGNNTSIAFSFYRVLSGENLSSVAEKFGLSMATVLSLNSLDNAHSIDVGEKVLLSTRSGIIFNTTNKESVHDIAERYGISAHDIMTVNELNSTDIQEGTTLFLPEANLSFKAMAEILGFQFINPVPRYRRVSSHFGWRRHPILGRRILHRGIDFAASIGTPILASKEGRVIFAGWNGGYGLHIVIRHSNGWTTSYSHQSKIFVKKGQWVTTGQRIGSVGNTGRSTGPHLHMELRKYGQAVNPIYNGLQLNR